ncbi:hypothetical protein SKA34_01672 [Photobacterium sp. SKA34]|uniref:hypothetical protein n=1 Tax=Photobacterium sp. SKA34 TaxID=121723 RepID=UPI00006BB5D6|nr:hypothetical protein [Photobacterium sp. SKA34]EAR56575.1 hypothetical protein SKA34_01672 [Photobacterium sp. SKA34]
MALKVFNSPINDFWHDQNLKLLANPFFLAEKGDVYSDTWFFRNKKGSINPLDFTCFDLPAFKLELVATYCKDGHEYALSSKTFAQLACLSQLTPTRLDSAIVTYQMMRHLMAFLKESNIAILDLEVLTSFWISFLGRSVAQYGFVNRISPPSYSAIKHAPLVKIRNALKGLGVVGVIDSTLTTKRIESSLDSVCQSLLSTTRAEYKKGGSFNFLGLELGQYYVDYLNGVYQRDFLNASVCKKALEGIIDKYDIASFNDKQKTRLFNVMLSSLFGGDDDKPNIHTKGINHNVLKAETEEALFNQYVQRFEAVTALKDQHIEALVIELGLSSRSDAMELIRVLMLKKYLGLKGHKTPHQVWQGYLLSLEKTFLDSALLNELSVDDVYAKMQSFLNKARLNKAQFRVDIQNWAKNQQSLTNDKPYQSFKTVIEKPFHAMTNLVVAWTGYRQSEFGFPLSAIQPEPNLDILDNAHVPFRFMLKWRVPKTGGSTKINREITSQCYQVAAQLHEVFKPLSDEPCLYPISDRTKKDKIHHSDCYINTRVKANWQGFVESYQPFNDVIALEEVMEKAPQQLTVSEQEKQTALSAQYTVGSARYKHLLACAKEVKKDWLRLSQLNFNSPIAQKKFKESLAQYITNGCVDNTAHQAIIDTYLSDATRELLKSGSVELNDIKTMGDISSEILEGVRYPSPHAFRHIWAESVLTRYQGDVGAVIRHQFAHLDGSFFMAYLRDKDARGLMTSAKQRYLNSIVDLLITEAEHIGETYLGGMARFVKKATSATKVRNESEERAHREAMKGRIIDIQVNPFATCIPRDGAERRAKCAQMGVLNPQDAKPEFCLNCAYALITEGNIKGIWQLIQPMVKEAHQEHAFGFLLEAHLPTLKSSWKRISELRNDMNAANVDKILSAINDAINEIEHKIQEEAKLYG